LGISNSEKKIAKLKDRSTDSSYREDLEEKKAEK